MAMTSAERKVRELQRMLERRISRKELRHPGDEVPDVEALFRAGVARWHSTRHLDHSSAGRLSVEEFAYQFAKADIEGRYQDPQPEWGGPIAFSRLSGDEDASGKDASGVTDEPESDDLVEWLRRPGADEDDDDTPRDLFTNIPAVGWKVIDDELWAKYIKQADETLARASHKLDAAWTFAGFREHLREILSASEFETLSNRDRFGLDQLAVAAGVSPQAIHDREQRVVRRACQEWVKLHGAPIPAELGLGRRHRHERVALNNVGYTRLVEDDSGGPSRRARAS